MSQSNEGNSRLTRNKKRRSDRLVNWLIIAVVIGIVITGWIALSPDESAKPEEEQSTSEEENASDDSDSNEETIFERAEDEQAEDETPADEKPEEDEDTEADEEEVEVIEDSGDPFVSESRINPAWEPIGTTQSGEHVSLYDGSSVDWKEKEQALLYATGLTEGNVIFWKIKNGGGPHQSVGIVSSMDKVEKYRVYLEWIDGEGWKPVRLDVLNTLEFDF